MNSLFRAATLTALVSFSTSSAFALPNRAEVIPARGGPIRITPIYHASLQIEYMGRVIQVDPFSAGNYSGAKKADVILITHSHPDHFDLKAIASVLKGHKHHLIVVPFTAVDALRDAGYSQATGEIQAMGNSYVVDLQSLLTAGKAKKSKIQMSVRAVPAYNIKRGPKPGQKFHPKGQFNGYVLTLGGKRIYIAGDTEATPEMKALRNIDVAFLPMNLPYTMTPLEAAQGARAFRPKIVYPYHYRYPFNKPNDNPQQFARALAGSGIEVRLRGWYAHPAGK